MELELSEEMRRREEINLDRSLPVTLADGAEWFLPWPYLEFRPIFKDGKPVLLTKSLSYNNAEIDGVIAGIAAAESDADRILLSLILGGLLVQRNYDVTDDELGDLIKWRADDPDSQILVHRFVNIATGGD